MPVQGYTNISGSNVALRQQTDPRASRTGFGEGIAALAQTLNQKNQQNEVVQNQIEANAHDLKIAELEKNRSKQITDQMGRFAEVKSSITEQLFEARNNTEAGAADYEKTSDEIVTKGLTEFINQLGDDDAVRQRFEPLAANFGATSRSREKLWGIGEQSKYQGQQLDKWQQVELNELQSDPTPEKLGDYFAQVDLLVGGLDLPGTAKNAVIVDAKAKGANILISSSIDNGNLDGVEALLKSDVLDQYLTPQSKDRYAKQIEGERRVLQLAKEREASQARTNAKNAIAAIEAKIAAGINPANGEFEAARQAALAAGLPEADIIEFSALSLEIGLNRQYSEEKDPTGAGAQSVVDGLRSKVADGTASEAEQIAYNHLKGVAQGRAKRAGAELKELAGKGVSGQIQALDTLQSLSPEQRFHAAQELGGGLGFVANLNPTARRFVLNGAEILKSRPKDFGEEAEIKEVFDNYLGGLKADLAGDYRHFQKISHNIFASAQSGGGRVGFDEAAFQSAIRIAFGATKNEQGKLQGGVAKWRGHAVELPDFSTLDDFDIALSRLDFSDSIYADGSSASKKDILENYRPKFIGPNAQGFPSYIFVDTNNKPLGGKKTPFFRFHIKPRKK